MGHHRKCPNCHARPRMPIKSPSTQVPTDNCTNSPREVLGWVISGQVRLAAGSADWRWRRLDFTGFRRGVLVRETRCAHQKQPPGVPPTVRTGRCAHQGASRESRVESREPECESGKRRAGIAHARLERRASKVRRVSEEGAASAWCLMASESCIFRPSAFRFPLSAFKPTVPPPSYPDRLRLSIVVNTLL